MTQMDRPDGLRAELKARKKEIESRLSGFKSNWKKGNKKIFSELVFCLCTPQSSALKCDEAVKRLEREKCYSSAAGVRKCLQGKVRFHNSKAEHILAAKKFFSRGGKITIKEILREQGIEKNPFRTREWLVGNVKGLGYKEASHFLRNTGFYGNIAILDRHILKNLVNLGVITSVPANLNREKYLSIEKKLIGFCKKEGIKPEELDLALWARETGFVFK